MKQKRLKYSADIIIASVQVCRGCWTSISSIGDFEPTQTIKLRGEITSMANSNTAHYNKVFLITHPLSLTEGGLACVECQTSAAAYLSPKHTTIITQQGFFYFLYYDLMHSYRTITYTNNNFIRLALAVITVSVQFMTSTNSPDTAPGEGRFLVYHLLLSMLTEFNHEK